MNKSALAKNAPSAVGIQTPGKCQSLLHAG